MRRSTIKILHWLSAALILYFFLIEPDENKVDPGGALSTHAGVGMILGIVVFIWVLMYLIKGMLGRPGPKLPDWGKRAHPILHKALYIGMPIMLITGGITGALAPFVVKGFGAIPLGFGIGSKGLFEILQEVHEIAFNALIFLIVTHTVFHLWRHFWLKDNALRIMVPKALHKYLR